MHPFEKAKRERYEELRGAIQTVRDVAVREDRGLTEAEHAKVREYAEEARSIWAEVEELAEEELRGRRVAELAAALGVDDAGQAPVPDPQEGVPGRVYSGPPRLLPAREGLVEAFRAARERRPLRLETSAEQVDHARTAIGLAEAGGAPAVGGPVTGGVRVASRRIATAFGSTNVDGYTEVKYPVFATETGRLPVAEGATKPEGADATPGSVTPQTMARVKTVSNQTLQTYSSFEGLLESSLSSGVVRDENKLIVDTITGAAGVQVYDATANTGEEPLTSVLVAIGMLEDSDAPGAFDMLIANPADLPRLLSGAMSNSQVNPQSDLFLGLFGSPIYLTASMASGQLLVGASTSARWIVGQAPFLLVDPYTAMDTNQTRVRLEEAAGLALPVPSGFVHVTLAPAA